MRHFFPELNSWLDELPDTRDPDAIVYPTRALAWWGLWLYLGQLGSRRQLDFQYDAWGTHVLDNLNRLAGTEQNIPVTRLPIRATRPSQAINALYCRMLAIGTR